MSELSAERRPVAPARSTGMMTAFRCKKLDVRNACSRVHAAAIAGAALLAASIETTADPIKTHHGLMLKLNELVDTGLVKAEDAKSVAEVQFLRQLADYSSTPPDAAATKVAVDMAAAFLAAIKAIVPAPPS